MSLTLYLHPLASYCHKVLIALYENGTAFEARFVDLADPNSSAEMLSYWPAGKIPLLRDERRKQTVPETSIQIEYLDQHYRGPVPLIPDDPELALQARLWDRFYDLYVMTPMQKIVVDRLRPPGKEDPFGVEDAHVSLRRAYAMAEQQLTGKTWAIGEAFSIADCAAAPALFYAGILEPFSPDYPNLAAYFERLVARPSFARVLVEARPYLRHFPMYSQVPARFLGQQ